jgi:glucose-6-phosphate 1-dehydrogenase
MNHNNPSSANIVIFGGNGDLTWRKLIPALYNLFIGNHLPARFSIICVDYLEMKEAAFKKHLLEGINTFSRNGKAVKKEWDKFSAAIQYQHGDFNADKTFTQLNTELVANDKQWKERGVRMFYYAVSPKFIDTISTALAKHKMADNFEADRIVVEKPFGNNLETAKALNDLLTTHFKEKQVYRIDHYLGKETVQNIMAFRFANTIFEPIWNRNYIDHVQISVAESIGIGNRGGYYDQSGALRDMIQNHLLQLLCFVAMEPPVAFNADEVRNKKRDVLNAIRPLKEEDVRKNIIGGQYGAGVLKGEKQVAYRKEQNVNPKSVTETFVAAKLFIDNWRWQEVPFYLRTGKCLQKSTSVIAIQFKPIPHALFPSEAIESLQPNQLIISIQPEMEITLLFHAKQPGLKLKISPVEMDFTYRESYEEQAPEAYETLLLDVLEGEATLFMRGDQVEAAWQVVMPILDFWKQHPCTGLPNYAAGSWGPEEAEGLIARDGFQWIHLPEQVEMKKKTGKK